MADRVGKPLWKLTQHIVRHYRRKAAKGAAGKASAAAAASASLTGAVEELSYRTRCVPSTVPPSVSDITATAWFATMATRYKKLTSAGVSAAVREEAQDVVGSMYGNGVSWSALPSALVTVASMMMEARVADSVLTTEGECIAAEKDPSGRATAADILDALLSIIGSTKTPGDGWWLQDDYDQSSPVVVAFGWRVDDPALFVEYRPSRESNKTKHRIISLREHLETTTPSTLPLAKKLYNSHHAFFASESELSTYLLKLQRAMKTAAEEAQELERHPSQHHFNPKAKDSSPPVHPPHPAHAAAAEGAVKKADVGLLFRDPEAALKDVDLQDADEVTVKEYKLKMDDEFQANIVRPGDAGYKYDIRVEVKPSKKSDWDDSDSD